jgi:hypothetical protein
MIRSNSLRGTVQEFFAETPELSAPNVERIDLSVAADA